MNDVFFVNSETGYVCGDSGVVLKTSNGGVNWYMLQSELNSNLNGIFFNDAFTGFIAGSKGKILKTTNSGINWLNLPNGSNIAAILKPIVFINYETGFVAGDQYLKTTNGEIIGQSYQAVE
ncbi:MAG: YCF48-related protein [Ignavibacteria bacterium]